MPLRAALALFLAALVAIPAAARDIRTEPVIFEPGRESARVSGRVESDETVDYLVGVEAGRRLTVSMATSHLASYFNILEPGAQDEAIFVGSTEGQSFDAVAEKSGFYRIRVYLMRSAARRNEVARYTLTVGVEGASSPDLDAPVRGDVADGLMGGPDWWAVAIDSGRLNLRAGPSRAAAIRARLEAGAALRNLGCRMAEGRRWCAVEAADGAQGWTAGEYLREGPAPDWADALAPGTPYHATGLARCSADGGPAEASCAFGVIRSGPGAAEVVLTAPDGGERRAIFAGGALVAIAPAVSYSASRDGDVTILRIGLERYDIPDAAPFGG